MWTLLRPFKNVCSASQKNRPILLEPGVQLGAYNYQIFLKFPNLWCQNLMIIGTETSPGCYCCIRKSIHPYGLQVTLAFRMLQVQNSKLETLKSLYQVVR